MRAACRPARQSISCLVAGTQDHANAHERAPSGFSQVAAGPESAAVVLVKKTDFEPTSSAQNVENCSFEADPTAEATSSQDGRSVDATSSDSSASEYDYYDDFTWMWGGRGRWGTGEPWHQICRHLSCSLSSSPQNQW
eukprot:TRINITY_DN14601_c0_g1_i6.p1 TRINITY_DN14601_c0_g1~~TRINITY_DN14601_c0_g1_i6.p1  ORF type:complete len:138 (-),score=11.36 TRINITY_DN14601_c0_g1_i6:328-741(-)